MHPGVRSEGNQLSMDWLSNIIESGDQSARVEIHLNEAILFENIGLGAILSR